MQSIPIGFSRVDTKDEWFFKKKFTGNTALQVKFSSSVILVIHLVNVNRSTVYLDLLKITKYILIKKLHFSFSEEKLK